MENTRGKELFDSLERAARAEESPEKNDAAKFTIDAIAEETQPIKLRWDRVSKAARFFTPGLSILGGPTGARKSWTSMEIGLACEICGEKWSYLPLEADRLFYLRRLACMLCGNFDPLLTLEDCQDAPARAAAAIKPIADVMNAIAYRIHDNPTLPRPGYEAMQVTPNWILDWARRRFEKGDRVVIIDPFCMIAFRGKDQWAAETDFIHSLVNLGYDKKGTIVLTVHTTKKLERGKPLDVTDLQGGAAISRNATSCILVQAVTDETFDVIREGGQREEVTVNCVLSIGKSRNSESGQRFAFTFGRPRPEFIEMGRISK